MQGCRAEAAAGSLGHGTFPVANARGLTWPVPHVFSRLLKGCCRAWLQTKPFDAVARWHWRSSGYRMVQLCAGEIHR